MGITIVFIEPTAVSPGNSLSKGVKYTGWQKIATFDLNRRLARKRCQIGPWFHGCYGMLIEVVGSHK